MGATKSFSLLFLVIFFGVLIFIQASLLGNPDSTFNRTTRFDMGRYSLLRTIFRLHKPGDARAQYLLPKSAIAISWLKPYSQDISKEVLNSFAQEITRQTGRPVNISFGGNVEEGIYTMENLGGEKFEALVQKPEGTLLIVFFVDDYSPRAEGEISTTYGESAIVVSFEGLNKFFQANGGQSGDYLLSSLLYGFGRQIGLKNNTQEDCIMNSSLSSGYSPKTRFFNTTPQQFCSLEERQILDIYSSLQN